MKSERAEKGPAFPSPRQLQELRHQDSKYATNHFPDALSAHVGDVVGGGDRISDSDIDAR